MTTRHPERADVALRTADGRQVRLEVLPASPHGMPIQQISHSSRALGVHAGAGGSAPLTTALFRYDTAEASSGPFLLRDTRTRQVRKPSSVRTVALDPMDPGATLLDASHLLMPRGGQVRALALVQRSSGEAMLLDYDPAGGPVRRTPLGFTPPIGSNKGSFTAAPDGRVWAALAATGSIRLFDLGDLSAEGPLQAEQKATLAPGAGFDPDSTRLGIIAILIGLLPEPAPTVSYQQDGELVAAVLDHASFRTVARESLPAGAQGLMEDEGLFLFFYLLPYIEQGHVFKTVSGTDPEPIMTIGR